MSTVANQPFESNVTLQIKIASIASLQQ